MGEGPLGLSSEQERALVAQAVSALKVFPLYGVVVFPGMTTPLHIFEPRYRALVADALASDRLVAVAALQSPDAAELERAPVLEAAGVGLIQEHEQLPEGRYHIMLRGLTRVQLLQELDQGKPYREFRVQVLDDVYPAGGPAALESQVEALEQCVYELATLLPRESGAPQLAEAAAHTRIPGRLADLVAAAVVSEPATRQRVLEEVDVARRLELVTGEVASVILMLSQGRVPRV